VPSSWTGSDLARAFADRCGAAGLDLAASLQVGWYNDAVEPHLRLHDFGNPQSLAVLIGNTRALWPRLLDALRTDLELLDDANPVEAYTVRHVRQAAVGLETAYEIRWAHDTEPHPIAIQRLAHIAGLAYLAPSNLSVHPTFGPWIALRAVLVADVTGPPGPPPVLPKPCDDCEHACLAAFRRAMAEPVEWRHWLEIRDACPSGRAYRYDELQILYHYTKDRDALRRAVEKRRAG
jgi:cyanocobalamin reductase (cyanide-eliminating) / alkylcobalamin dealkylase